MHMNILEKMDLFWKNTDYARAVVWFALLWSYKWIGQNQAYNFFPITPNSHHFMHVHNAHNVCIHYKSLQGQSQNVSISWQPGRYTFITAFSYRCHIRSENWDWCSLWQKVLTLAGPGFSLKFDKLNIIYLFVR